MEPDRFGRIKALLLAVADLNESKRRAYLDEACKNDAELRREVESILAHEHDPTGALKTSGALLDRLHGAPSHGVDDHASELAHASPSGDPTVAAAHRVTRSGNYVIEGELGRGGMGVVYRARDDRLKRQVALKILPAAVARDPSRVQRFEREAQLLAALNHPSIATIYTLEEAEDVHFLTMELVPGDTLADRIAAGPLNLDDALSVCRQIATAVEAAHKNGVIHRDLKPVNVKITPEGRVKVLDFGIAKAIGDSDSDPASQLTGTGATLGTPGYMSPEQIRGEATDHRADIFAFGCVLYECLTGERVFRGGTGLEVAAATLDRDPNWNLLPAETPQALRDLLDRCLAKDINERLAEMAEARRGLEEVVVARRAPPALSIESRHGEAAPRNNLPVQITSFVGRERELAEIEKLLTGTHLLTLTGVGGCGKTRLGLEVATRSFDAFPHGIWLVELAPLVDPRLVPQTVMSTLGLQEEAGRTAIDSLAIFFKEKTSLLILDNCEHLLAATAKLADTLLRACPELKILASSREGLGITGETTYHVPSLELPDANGELQLTQVREVDAVRLFVERAAAAVPGFTLTEENAVATVEICRRLDGIPLAIELAAARLKAMSVKEVSERLDDRFRLLTGGSRAALPRHQTLRALIDWSHEQLTTEEQALFRRLSVFAGGWSLDAAEAVGAGEGETLAEWEVLDLLTHLVDKSLVEIGTEKGRHSTRSRYRMLETVRQYAVERLLQAGEGDEARRRHRDFFLALADEAAPQLLAAEQLEWFDRLDAEHDNLRVALVTCASAQSAPELGSRLVEALATYWRVRGFWTEGRAHCTELLSRSDSEGAPRIGVLLTAGWLTAFLGNIGEARKLLEECLTLSQRTKADARVAGALFVLGVCAYHEGDRDRGRELTEEALDLYRDLGDKFGTLICLHNLAALNTTSDSEQVIRSHNETLGMAREVGDRVAMTMVLKSLGYQHGRLCNYDKARSAYEEGLRLARELRFPFREAELLNNLACLAHTQGRLNDCQTLSEEALAMSRELASRDVIARSLHHLAMVFENQGDDAAAETLYAQALATQRETGSLPGIVWALGDLAVHSARRHDVGRARAYIEEALGILEGLADRAGLEGEVLQLGYALARFGDHEHARRLLADSHVLHRDSCTELDMPALEVYAVLAMGAGDRERAARLFGAAEALRERVGAPRLPEEERDFETDRAALRSELGEEAFARAYAEGRAMGTEQALAHALGESDWEGQP